MFHLLVVSSVLCWGDCVDGEGVIKSRLMKSVSEISSLCSRVLFPYSTSDACGSEFQVASSLGGT